MELWLVAWKHCLSYYEDWHIQTVCVIYIIFFGRPKVLPQIDIVSEFYPRIWDLKSIQFEGLSLRLKFKFNKNIWTDLQ